MLCQKCKKELPENAVFCPYCGKKQLSQPRKTRKRPNGTGNISKLSGSRRKPWVVTGGGIYGTVKKIDLASGIVEIEIAKGVVIRVDKA